MSDPYRRDAASGGQGDPLAELARLIGQNDPFADLGRSPHAPAARQPAVSQDRHGETADAASYRASHQDAYAQPEPGYAPGHHELAEQPHDHGAHSHDPSVSDLHARQEPYADAFHAEAAPQADYGQHQPAHDRQDYAYQDQTYYAGEAQPHGDPSAYDLPAPARRRGGLVAVMGVLALAVLGTAGAFAYRATFGVPGTPSQPPVIKAAETPNKVPTASADSTKLIQDRLPDRPQGERVVSREEQPVDVRTPNIAFPPLAPPNTKPANAGGPPVLPQVAAAAGPGISAEPKKIRTVQIRPDQDGAPRAQPSSPPRPAVAPAPSAPSASADSPFPSAARAARQQPDAVASANGPLSLSPTGSTNAPAPARNRIQTASVPAAPSAGAAAGPGSYVQVTSQRSEADAQASFRALQGKYPSVLGGKQPVIRRADLGDKGVFYRAMVGPFGSTDQATQICGSLKAAGGTCVVQRN